VEIKDKAVTTEELPETIEERRLTKKKLLLP